MLDSVYFLISVSVLVECLEGQVSYPNCDGWRTPSDSSTFKMARRFTSDKQELETVRQLHDKEYN